MAGFGWLNEFLFSKGVIYMDIGPFARLPVMEQLV